MKRKYKKIEKKDEWQTEIRSVRKQKTNKGNNEKMQWVKNETKKKKDEWVIETGNERKTEEQKDIMRWCSELNSKQRNTKYTE